MDNHTNEIIPSESGKVLAEFSLPSQPGNERQAMELVVAAIQDLELPQATIERLKTAVGEAVMNAMEHGNKYNPSLPVDIRIAASTGSLSIFVTDHGEDVIKEPSEPPNLEAKLEGLQSPRGWGLFLIEHMVDELNFTSGDHHHTIELIIHIPGRP
jgi:anti-sigma regulatory factor (Ser/Thr protein kinase)